MRLLILSGLMVGWVGAETCLGSLVYMNQDRMVEVRTNHVTQAEKHAQSIGLFDANLGYARQESSLGANGFWASGSAFARESPPAGSTWTNGLNKFQVKFELTEDTKYQLVAKMENVVDIGNHGHFFFNGIEVYKGDYIPGPADWDFEPLDIGQTGFLPAGAYSLEMMLTGGLGGNSYSLSFQVIPEPSSMLLGVCLLIFIVYPGRHSQ